MNNNRDAIVINKEIRDYTESVFFGLNLRQCIFSVFACMIAVLIYFGVQPVLGTEITSWLCILGAFPFAAMGFVTFQGMNAEEIVIECWHSYQLSKQNLYDKPTNLYIELSKEYLTLQKEGGRKRVKKLRKNKKIKERTV